MQFPAVGPLHTQQPTTSGKLHLPRDIPAGLPLKPPGALTWWGIFLEDRPTPSYDSGETPVHLCVPALLGQLVRRCVCYP